MENHHFQWVNQRTTWQFSLATCWFRVHSQTLPSQQWPGIHRKIHLPSLHFWPKNEPNPALFQRAILSPTEARTFPPAPLQLQSRWEDAPTNLMPIKRLFLVSRFCFIQHAQEVLASTTKSSPSRTDSIGLETSPDPKRKLVGGWWLGHPSEKYESQLGWLETQYMGK